MVTILKFRKDYCCSRWYGRGFFDATQCCGGILVATRARVGEQMSADILKSIIKSGAEVIVTPCSLCQTTLEAALRKSKKLLGQKVCLPVLTISQLIGLAMGKSNKEVALQRSLAPRACLKKLSSRPAA